MNKNDDQLEHRIKQFYESQSLPNDMLSQLKSDIQTEKSARTARTVGSLYSYAAFAAVLLVVGIVTLFGMERYYENRHVEQVAAEIALNHVKRFDTEFATPSIANLSSEMDLLDFAPVYPKRLSLSTYDMIGARYCTIDSAIAVQIHMEDEADNPYTLYEFRDPSGFMAGQERVITVDGIQVTLWKEGEVIMGLAKNAPELTIE